MTALTAGVEIAPPFKESRCIECAHCGLDVPAGLLHLERDKQFCCNGCEAAYEAINACGLRDYYELKSRLAETGEAARRGPGRYTEFDDPAFTERHIESLPGGACSVELYIEGVHCAACVWLLEKLPSVVPGVTICEVDLSRRTATVQWDAVRIALSEICRAFDRFGYVPHPVEPSAQRDARKNEDRAYMIRIGVAAACAGNVMLLAFALYSGEFDAIGEPYLTLFRWMSAGIGVLSLLWPGKPFISGAIAALRAKVWHLDMPIALALVVGTFAGVFAVARGSGEIYFDSLTMLILLLLIARWIQLRQQRRATDAIEMLFSVTPRRVRLVRADCVEDASIDAVNRGDLVEIGPQECVPVDGVIESGTTSVDNSMLSGESLPIPLTSGDAVSAGAVNLGSSIRVRVEAAGRTTRVGRLMSDIERLGRSRTPIIGSADKIAKPFVLGVFLASGICLSVRAPTDLGHALEAAVALLIVCCPCAVALATPLATSIAIGRLAHCGILIKGGDTFEPLASTPTLLLDKTGTVTEGRFTIRTWTGDESLKPAVAALEAGSSHPVAIALAAVAEPPSTSTQAHHHLGLGVTGHIDEMSLAVGSRRLMLDLDIDEPPWASEASHIAADLHCTPVFIAKNNEIRAVAALGDAIRPDAMPCLDELAAAGWKPELLSGDEPRMVEHTARSLGITRATGGASPEQKLERVAQASTDGPTVMVGDGVNDAPALSAATVGVAVSGGAEASLMAADVYLSEPGLAPLADLARTARSVTRRIRLCLGLAISYNIVAGALAIAGFISPLLAAVIMPASSLTVLFIALGAGKARRQ
ncbi:MAG: heavy metal translocating P-type ATPase [Planctomycetota bacterium]